MLSGVDAETDIMEKMWQILQQNGTITMINAFRGVPITCEARMIMTSQNHAAFNVTPHQVVCLSMEKSTYLLSEHFPETVKARVMTVDLPQTDVILTRFGYVGNVLGKRADVRVQPKEPLQVQVQAGEFETAATLADVSRSGLGMFSFAAYINPSFEYKRNAAVSITLRLPPDDAVISLPGKITNITRERGTVLSRIGIQTVPDEGAEAVIQGYITHRRGEILEELEQLYQVMKRQASEKAKI